MAMLKALRWLVAILLSLGLSIGAPALAQQKADTRSNAYMLFQEKKLGSLEPGKLADLVVLDRDYMTVPAAEIKRIRPTMTMAAGGRVVYINRK